MYFIQVEVPCSFTSDDCSSNGGNQCKYCGFTFEYSWFIQMGMRTINLLYWRLQKASWDFNIKIQRAEQKAQTLTTVSLRKSRFISNNVHCYASLKMAFHFPCILSERKQQSGRKPGWRFYQNRTLDRWCVQNFNQYSFIRWIQNLRLPFHKLCIKPPIYCHIGIYIRAT